MSRPLKATALICVLCLLLTVPALAASDIRALKLSDYFFDSTVDAEGDRLVRYRFGTITPYNSIYYSGVVYYEGSRDGYDFAPVGQNVNWHIWPLGRKVTTSSGLLGSCIDVRDLKAYSTAILQTQAQLNYKYRWTSMAAGDANFIVGGIWLFYWYNEDGSFRTVTTGGQKSQSITLAEVNPDSEGSGSAYLFGAAVPFQVPSGAAYLVPTLQLNITFPDQDEGIVVTNINCTQPNYDILLSYNVFAEDSETLKALKDQVGDLNDKMDELVQQPEQEKQEALGGGDAAADQLVSVIPDHSEGFMTAIQELADAMSYDGTEAKLTFPSITLPEIPGVMKKYVLSKPYPVDFGFWIQKMPDKLLTLVQVLGTLALVVYSFKELYGTLSYALTLKGGSTDG